MSALDHYDYRQLQVAKDGSLVDRDQVRALRKLADDSTDVLVLSHGWNNDMAEAHAALRADRDQPGRCPWCARTPAGRTAPSRSAG